MSPRGVERGDAAASPVVITGAGSVCAAGQGCAALAAALRRGLALARRRVSGASAAARLPVASADDFDPLSFLDRREVRRLGRANQLGVAAAEVALADAGRVQESWLPARVGLFEASSLGSLAETLGAHRRLLERGPRSLSPQLLDSSMNGSAGGVLSRRHGIRGPTWALSNGSCSSATALAAAHSALRLGEIDVALVVAAEAPLAPEILELFARGGLLSTGTDEREPACRPFDRDRDGTVLGEAGAAMVLETPDHARERGARARARLCSIGQSTDAAHRVAPTEGGHERARAMVRALEAACVRPEEIDYVAAHATATRLNDPSEANAMQRALGSHVGRVAVSGMKSILGHTLGACSLLECVATLAAMQGGFIPPTANLVHPDPDCRLDHVVQTPRPAHIDVAMVNSASFGGRNTSVVLRRS